METRAARDGDGWVLTRQQAVDHQRQPGRRGRGLGPLRRGRGRLPGRARHARLHDQPHPRQVLAAGQRHRRAGVRRVRLPDGARLPGARGLKAPLACLNQARYGIAWGAVGAAMDCYDTALRYAGERLAVRPAHRLVPAGAAEAGDHGDGDHQGAGPVPAAGPAQGRRARPRCRWSRWPNATTWPWRWTAPARPATSWAPRGITDEFSPGRHMANLESVYTYEGDARHPHADRGAGDHGPGGVPLAGAALSVYASRFRRGAVFFNAGAGLVAHPDPYPAPGREW